jgi:hypothetical protein
MRLSLEHLETRVTPSIDLSGITLNTPFNAALPFTPSDGTAAQPNDAGTPVSAEGQTVVTGEHLLFFHSTTPVADLPILTATIHWGDGSPDTTATQANGGIIAFDNTVFGTNLAVVTTAAAPHVYGEALGGPVYSVSVTDGATTISDGQPINVAEVQLTNLTGAGFNTFLNEGNATIPSQVATFTDPGGAEPVANYTATVDYGDGTTASGTVVNIGGNNFGVNAAAHTYTEEGTYTVNVTVQHLTEAPLTVVAGTNTVLEVQITNLTGAGAAQSINEGAASAAITGLATFTDPAGAEVPANYSTVIDWGDGSPTSPGTVVNVVGNNFRVDAPTHTYAEEGSYTVKVSVTHETAATQTVNAASITVNEVQINLTGANLPQGTLSEGTTTPFAGNAATFVDSAGAESVANYTATVNWGDGTPSQPATVINIGGNNFAVTIPGTHTYAEESPAGSPYQITITVQHEAAAPQTVLAEPVVITEVLISGLTGSGAAQTIDEGGSTTAITGLATFTDTAGAEVPANYTTTIDWGDGSPTSPGTVVNVGGNNFRVDAAAHTYAEEGTYTVTVDVTHETSPKLTVTAATVTVNEVQITNLAGIGNVVVNEGQLVPNFVVATFTDPAGAEPVANYAATVHYGDGGTGVGIIANIGGNNYSISAPAHTWVEEGSYPGTVDVTHELEPMLTTGWGPITVNEVQLTNLAGAGPVNLPEGTTYTATGIATFTDPAGAEPNPSDPAGTHYTASIDWGDGNTSAGTIVNVGGENFRVDGTHLYAEEGTYTITVTVQHEAAPALSVVPGTATITEVQLTNFTVTAPNPFPDEGTSEGPGVAVATFTDPAGAEPNPADPAGTHYTATIDWGDGTGTHAGTVVSLGGNDFEIDDPSGHIYAEEGDFTLTVTVTHETAATLTGTANYSVQDLPVDGVAGPNINAVENGNTSLAVLATFTDPGDFGPPIPLEPVGEYSATVQWGDGTISDTGDPSPTVFIIQPDPTVNQFEVVGQHIYTEESAGTGYAITTTIHHFSEIAPGVLDTVVTGQKAVVADQQITGVGIGTVPTSTEGTSTGPITGLATFTDPAGLEGRVINIPARSGGSLEDDNIINVGATSGTLTIQYDMFSIPDRADVYYGIKGAGGIDIFQTGLISGSGTFSIPFGPIGAFSSSFIEIVWNQGGNPGGAGSAWTYSGSVTTTNLAVDYVTTINWGDGTTSPGTVVLVSQDLAGAHFRVDSPGHTYASASTHPVSVSVKHDLLPAITSPTTLATVNEAPLTAGALTVPSVTEGAGVTNAVLFHFTDGNPLGTVADFVATVSWGDGTTESSALSPNVTVVANAGGGFDVVGTHTYLEEVTGTFTVTVVDDTVSTSASKAITVADAPLTVTGKAITGVEAASTGLVTVATFTDADPNGITSDYSATVAWGDATSGSGVIVDEGIVGGVHTFAVKASHVYAEEGTFTMTITVTDAGGATNSNTAAAVIADAPLTGTLFPPSPVEGTSFTAVLFHFSDADPGAVAGDFTATVTWGDGTVESSATSANVSVVANASGGFDVIGTHTYTEEGAYPTFKVSVADAGGATVSNTATVNVSDPAVVPFGGFGFTGTEGATPPFTQVVATFADPGGAEITAGVPTPGEYSATIAWGDGSSDTVTEVGSAAGSIIWFGGNSFGVLGSHMYAEEGTFTITVTVHHGSAPDASTTSTATVSDPAVVLNTALLTFSAQENKPSFQQAVATFTDPGGAEITGGVPNTGEYEATINWGDPKDPNPTSGTITWDPVALQFVVYGAHTYTGEDGTYPVTVTVAHGGDAPSTGHTANAVVANVSALVIGNFTVMGAEGSTPAAGQTVAVFTDPGGSTTASDFTADINWGDGTGVHLGAGIITYDAASGRFIVTGNPPKYTEEGIYTVTVTVNHPVANAAPPVTVTSTAMISDPALVATGAAVSAVEGTSFTGSVATFTDPGGPELLPAGTPDPEDYVATISWGDGTAPTTGTITFDAGTGIFTVSGTHTYTGEGHYTVTTTLVHAGEDATTGIPSSTTVTTSSAAVIDPSVIASVAPPPFGGVEGTVPVVQPVATFTDPGGAEGLVFYSATIDWGDGTGLTNGVITFDPVLGVFTVSGTHTYPDEGFWAITVTVNHANAAPATFFSVAHITDAPLTSNQQDLTPPTATEGQTFGAGTQVVLFHFGDTNTMATAADFTAVVNWGDGTTESSATSANVNVIAHSGGGFDVVGTHTYVEEVTAGLFKVTVTDVGGMTTSQSAIISVADASVAATGGFTVSGVENASTGAQTVATFTDPAGAEPSIDYTATIFWGDGTSGAGTVTGPDATGTFTVAGTHTYSAEGSYNIRVVINHDAAASVTVNSSAVITDPSVVVSPAPAISVVEGAQFMRPVATFTDPGGAEGLTHYSALINWGDGSPLTNGVITVSGTTFTVSGAHTYADESPAGTPFSITVTVSHDAAPAASNAAPTLATVTDAALSSNPQDLTVPAATEGVAFGPAVLLHFADANPMATAADFTATVTWGDGDVESNGANVSVVAHTGGGFDVIGSHSYAEELTGATFTVLVTDKGGATTTQSGRLNVADAALTSTPGGLTALKPTEGVNTGNIILLHFADADPNGTVSDYTAVVSWGDGTVESSAGAPAHVQIVKDPVSGFDVTGNHTYLDEATGLTFSVTVSDAGSSTTQSTTINVADAPLSAGAITPPIAVEGAPTGVVTLFHFTDANPNAATTDFTATVSWGDGTVDTTSTGIAIVASAGGGFDVRGGHTYAEEGTGLLFTVTVTDHSSTASGTAGMNVADAPLTMRSVIAPSATEGQPTGVIQVANFTDADPGGVTTDYSATIAWGDGTSSVGVVVNNGDGTFGVQGSHTYLEESTPAGLTMTVTVVDHNATTSGTATVVVADAALTGTLFAPSPTEGAPISGAILMHFNDADANGNPADFTATVTWGDGGVDVSGGGIVSVVPAAGGGFNVIGSHTYLEEATGITFSVSVKDAGGSTLTLSSAINVADAALAITSLTPPTNVTEGVSTGIIAVATFTDADPNGVATDYTATIIWGDGTVDTVTSAGGGITGSLGGPFTVHGAHTYAEEGTTSVPFEVIVVDNRATASATDGFITIADANLTLVSIGPPTSPTEGVNTGVITVATFTDGDAGATAAEFTATVSWGDGTVDTVTSANGGISGPVGGVFSVRDSHTYREEGTGLTFSVTINDTDGGNSVTGSALINVADAALTVTTTTPPAPTEGQYTGLVTLATFTDADINGTATDYAAQISWGDGTAPEPGVIVDNGLGINGLRSFSVKGSHVFVEEATGLTMTLTIVDHNSTVSTSGTFNVTDAPLIGTLYAPTPTEGLAISSAVLFHFNDSDTGPELLGNYTATVNWGDGTIETFGVSPNVSLVSNPAGGFDVVGSHTYLEEVNAPAFLSFSVTASDTGGATITGNAHITVADAAISISTLIPPTGAVEGVPVTTTTVFTDADPNGTASDYTATVVWGDGTTSTITSTLSAAGQITATGGAFTVTATHTYAEEGTTNALYSVTVTDNNATAIKVGGTVTVADAALTVVTVTPPTATEGLSTGSQVVATFTDADAGGVPSDYTAIVNWGDGTSSTVTSAGAGITESGGVFSVHASHTYLEESTGLTMTVTVFDNGASAAGSATETVADAALSITAVTPPTAVESTNTGLVAVATFTDADPNGNVSDYTASITWGDGATSQGVVVSNGNGTFSVLGSHTFGEEAAGLTLSVTVTDNKATATSSATFAVADAALFGTILPPSPTEGAPITNAVLFHFTDSDPSGVATDYTAVVTWGDGSSDSSAAPVPVVLVVASPVGGFDVVGSHTYLEEATGLTFSVAVSDHGASVSGSARINVADAALSMASFTPPANVTEGVPVTATATFTDADPNGTASDYTATVVWGDGTTSTITSALTPGGQITSAGGVFTVTATHTYADEGTTLLPFSITINDNGASVSRTGTLVNINDANLTITSVTGPAAPTEGASTGSIAVATFTDGNPTATTADFTAVVSWGDGTSDTITSAGGGITLAGGVFTVHGTHTYAEEASGLIVSVTITDEGGSTASQNAAIPVNVADAALTITTVTPPAATEGVNTGHALVASFTDADPAGITSDYNATINWGDGSTTVGTIVDQGSPGGVHTFGVQGNHTYAEEGTFTITVTVTDHNATNTKTGTVNVAEAPLNGQVFAPNATEGAPFSGIVFHFTDVDPASTPADFTSTVTWGDGVTNKSTDLNPVVAVVASPAGGFDVVASHTYLEEHTGITFNVSVTDETETINSSATINVADAALTVTSVTPPANATEGISTGSIAVATFTDADPNGTPTDYVATVFWGDGTSDTTTNITQSGNVFTVHDSHTFPDEETGIIMTVTIKDLGGATATGTSAPFNVAGAPLTSGNSQLTPPNVLEGQSTGVITVLTFTDADPTAALSDFTATISWGDGTTSAGTVVDNGIVVGGHSFSVTGQHLYHEDGNLPFSVTVSDIDGQSLTATGTAVVREAPVTTSTNVDFTAVQGQAVQNQLVATFTDLSKGTDPDFTASIAWGDGDVSNGTVTYNSTTNLYEVHASKPNPYAQSGTHHNQVITTIFDDSTQAAQTTGSVTVALAADNFNPGPKSSLGAKWTDQSGGWAINPNGEAFPVQLTDGHFQSFATYNGSMALDEVVSADFSLPPSSGPARAGLVLHFTREGQDYKDLMFYYGGVYTRGGNNATYIAQIDSMFNGFPHVAAQAVVPGFDPSKMHHMEFSDINSSLMLTVDGTMVLQLATSILKLPGYVGILGAFSTFDNFLATNPDADPVDLPYTDTFTQTKNGAIGAAWSDKLGAFAVSNNSAIAFGKGVNYASLNTNSLVTDAMLKTDINISALAGANAGLVARASATADTNEYLGKITYAGKSRGVYHYTAQIVYYKNGRAIVLGSKTLNLGVPLTGTLEFDVVGAQLRLSFNGTQLVNTFHTALTTGQVGIRGSKASFKNFNAV